MTREEIEQVRYLWRKDQRDRRRKEIEERIQDELGLISDLLEIRIALDKGEKFIDNHGREVTEANALTYEEINEHVLNLKNKMFFFFPKE